MLDYQAIAALAAVIETQGFQSAADKLFITQSAVSQRIKSLERYYGEPVLIRAQPYRATSLGIMLLGHYKRVTLLEESLQTNLSESVPRISVSLSRDSLETWFSVVLTRLKKLMPVTVDIIADDQEQTLTYLQQGLVSACASTASKSPSGCKADFLGYFDYLLVATPEFKEKYFSNRNDVKKNLLKAPTVIFDQNDKLQSDYLKHFFNIDHPLINYHVVPSVAGFKQFALSGYAYTMIPAIDITAELKQKKLVNLFPDKVWQMPVYWHSWQVETTTYKSFHHLVITTGSEVLRQK